MKLLLDQNLSSRMVESIQSAFPDSTHIKTVGLAKSSDDKIWKYAQAHQFTIVTKDSDFLFLAMLMGAPPKVVHLRIGNAPTGRAKQVLLDNADLIRGFISDPTKSLLILA